MPHERWNPWKMTTIGLALVIATALITGLVVASWYKPDVPAQTALAPPTPAAAPPATPRAAAPARVAASPPPSTAVDSCNAQAREAQAKSSDKTGEVVRDAAVGGALGAGVGAAGGAIASGGKGAGKGAGIGGIVGLAAGTLYGLDKAKSSDQRYVEAYRDCMRARGHLG